MALLNVRNVVVAGMSAGVPEHVEPTVSTTSKYGAEDYFATTGILEKRYSNDFTTSDLGFAAAERLISDLHWDKKEIKALVFVSQTADYILPATACILQDRLGLSKECYCLDSALAAQAGYMA